MLIYNPPKKTIKSSFELILITGNSTGLEYTVYLVISNRLLQLLFDSPIFFVLQITYDGRTEALISI